MIVSSFWLCITRHAQSTKNNFAYLCSISKKAWVMKLIFYLQINTKIFYELIVSFWVCMTRHAQSTQNNNFIISLQYLKENVKDGVDFSLLIIVKCFFKVILSFLMCVARHAQITHTKKSLLFLCNILRGKWMTKLTFCMQVSMKTHYKLILWFWLRWSSISKVSKIASVQCHLQKEDRDKLTFCMQISIKMAFNTLGTEVDFFFCGQHFKKVRNEGMNVMLWMLGMNVRNEFFACR